VRQRSDVGVGFVQVMGGCVYPLDEVLRIGDLFVKGEVEGQLG
jgi:hypothetical protein